MKSSKKINEPRSSFSPMKKLIALGAVALIAQCPVQAQPPADENEGLKMTYNSTNGSFLLSWWGLAGRSYFIQYSDNLTVWNYLPAIEQGSNATITYGFTSTGIRYFTRLRYSDIPTSDPYGADFDGDGMTNGAELTAGSDPLATDTDHDGMPDAWEIQYGFSVTDPADAAGDPDGDGLSNKDEYTFNLNPNIREWDTVTVRTNFIYTKNDELSSYNAPGGGSATYNPDAEGNIRR